MLVIQLYQTTSVGITALSFRTIKMLDADQIKSSFSMRAFRFLTTHTHVIIRGTQTRKGEQLSRMQCPEIPSVLKGLHVASLPTIFDDT